MKLEFQSHMMIGSKLIINLEKEYQRMVDDSLMMWNISNLRMMGYTDIQHHFFDIQIINVQTNKNETTDKKMFTPNGYFKIN